MADFTVLANMPAHIAFHAVCASAALALTPFVLWRQRRDGLHKKLGYSWVTLMALTALSSFTITGVGGAGHFSFLHGLAIFTLITLYLAVRDAIKGNIERHRAALRNLATFGLALPMVLNFIPGRTFSRALADGNPILGLILMFGIYGAVIIWRLSKRQDLYMRSRENRA